MTNKKLFSLFTVIFVFVTTLNVSAQKDKNDDEDNGKGQACLEHSTPQLIETKIYAAGPAVRWTVTAPST